MLSPIQQAVDLIQKSKNILIALPENLNGDSLGSALALAQTLQKLDKKAVIVAKETTPEKLKFLPYAESLKTQPSSLRDFIISIDTSQNKISSLRYTQENDTLKIFLSAPQKIEEKNLNLKYGSFNYDLIMVLDSPDLESLGKIFSENTDLFYNKPILNIDNKASNEYFGEVNLIEPKASACAEIIFNLIESLGISLIDPNIATALLTGIIEKTKSFQNSKTTPQALNLASLLIIKGGEQEKIIQNLYKTKPLNSLKLWGRMLGRLDFDENKKIAWLFAQPEDFRETQTTTKDLPFILEETFDLFPQIKLSFALWKDENGFVGLLAQAKQQEILQKISAEISGITKNNKLLAKTNETSKKVLKEKICGLLNSFE